MSPYELFTAALDDIAMVVLARDSGLSSVDHRRIKGAYETLAGLAGHMPDATQAEVAAFSCTDAATTGVPGLSGRPEDPETADEAVFTVRDGVHKSAHDEAREHDAALRQRIAMFGSVIRTDCDDIAAHPLRIFRNIRLLTRVARFSAREADLLAGIADPREGDPQ